MRGTNSTEGYHRHIRKLLGQFGGSPKLIHYILLEFNFRWNLRSSVRNRGHPKDVCGFYDHPKIELIRDLCSGWNFPPLFPSIPSVRDFHDTGERFGLSKSKSLSRVGEAPLYDQVAFVSQQSSSQQNERIPFMNITASALSFGELQQFLIPTMEITTPAERTKFRSEWSQYRNVGSNLAERNSQRFKHLDFDLWARKWNEAVDEMEKGAIPWT